MSVWQQSQPPVTGVAAVGFDSEALVATLGRSTVLAQCSRQELARLIPFFRHRELQPGEALCLAGQPAGDMWLVLQGTLRLKRADESLLEISHGFVGEEAALGIGSYLADIVAIGPATVAALAKDAVPPVLLGQNARAEAFGRSLISAFAPTRFDPAPVAAAPDRLPPVLALWKALGWIAAVVAPLLLLQLVADSGLRWEQRQLAAVLVSTGALWIFGAVPPYVAGLLVVLVCVTLGIVPASVVLSGYASNGFFLALSIFSLGTVLVESGVINRIFLLLMKHCPRSAFWHDVAALFSGFVLTPLVASSRDRVRVLAPLAVESAETLGYHGGSRDRTRLLLATFMGLSLFSPVFLTGGALNLMLYGSLPEQVQDAIPALRWVVAALAATVVMLGTFFAAYALVFRHASPPREPRTTIDAQLTLLGPVRPTEWLAVGGVLLFLGAVATVSAHKVDHRLVALTIVCGYLVLGQLGRTHLNLHIDWSTLMLLGTVIGLISTIVYVDLHGVIAAQLPWLSHTMANNPRLFVAMLAGVVLLGELWIPFAGTLIAVIAVPLGMFNGMNPWVIVFVILLMSDTWILPHQSETYRTFRDAVRSSAPFDEKLFLRFNGAMAVGRIAALAASIFYWESLLLL